MQRSVDVVDDAGTVLASFVADTDMGGIAVSFFGMWHSPVLMARYSAEMQTLSQWLTDQDNLISTTKASELASVANNGVA